MDIATLKKRVKSVATSGGPRAHQGHLISVCGDAKAAMRAGASAEEAVRQTLSAFEARFGYRIKHPQDLEALRQATT